MTPGQMWLKEHGALSSDKPGDVGSGIVVAQKMPPRVDKRISLQKALDIVMPCKLQYVSVGRRTLR